jgi:hypothetical protein
MGKTFRKLDKDAKFTKDTFAPRKNKNSDNPKNKVRRIERAIKTKDTSYFDEDEYFGNDND